MDRDRKPSPSDGRATRRELLLRRLVQMLDELALAGVAGPEALEDLVRRNPTPISPDR
jgi:hypothetical protein